MEGSMGEINQTSSNGWSEYKRDVYTRFDHLDNGIKDIKQCMDELYDKLNDHIKESCIFEETTKLKLQRRAMLYGALGSLLGVVVAIVLIVLKII